MKIKIMNLYSFDSRWRDNITQFVNQNHRQYPEYPLV